MPPSAKRWRRSPDRDADADDTLDRSHSPVLFSSSAAKRAKIQSLPPSLPTATSSATSSAVLKLYVRIEDKVPPIGCSLSALLRWFL